MSHPGAGKKPLSKEEAGNKFALLSETVRTGKSAAYIHVPFCETHCLYCGFYKKKYDAAESAVYTDHVIQELSVGVDSVMQSGAPVHAVYLGGGTPTSLEASDLKRLLIAVQKYLPLANDCEITVEGRIANFGQEKMEACLEGGANRFSLGVQTFNTELRQSMKRVVDRDTAITELARLKSYDQASVVIDLIYGFPGQTMEMWQNDIATYLDLELDGVDLYQLKVFPQTPLFGAIEKGRFAPALDLETKAHMYVKGCEMMIENQYRRLSVNHWGRTTRERNIYNHLMRSPSNCLGFGPGAGGNIHGHSYMNIGDYKEWKEVVSTGQKPIGMMMNKNRFNLIDKTITGEFELCRVSTRELDKKIGLNMSDCLDPLFQQWTKAGLLERKGDWHSLTPAGQFWQTSIAQRTIDYLHSTILKDQVR